jgi:hypothetical protein
VTDRRLIVGYNRTVRLRWLDETLDLLLTGQPEKDIIDILRQRLSGQLSVGSEAERGSREKTITLLLKTWVRVPKSLRGLRDDGIQLLARLRRQERLPIHWGMTMAVYPFWRVVADVTGRLFHLQGTASAQQIQRRVKELHGEREAVSRSARYVVRAFADWGVMTDSERRGTYTPASPLPIDDVAVAAWLMEATLLASDPAASDIRSLQNSPALFPFRIPRVPASYLTHSGRIDVVRHGLEDELLTARRILSRR